MQPYFIVNPQAGSGRTEKIWPKLKEQLETQGMNVAVSMTASPAEGTVIAKNAVEQGYDTVVAVGGDGTVHEVVNGIVNTGVKLAVIPTGTGNDFARVMGIPSDWSEAAKVLSRGRVRRIDLGWLNDRYFVNIGGVGFDAEVAAAANRFKKRMPGRVPGMVPYVFGILQMLFSYMNKDMNITLRGPEGEIILNPRTFLVAAGNSAYTGGGMHICPGASLSDGLFHVVLAEDLSKLDTLLLLPRVFSGSHVKHKKVSQFLAEEIVVTCEQELNVYADGEVYAVTPAHFKAMAGALEVIIS